MGIDLSACPPAEHNGTGPLRLLFVGRIARVRRLELILEALRLLEMDWELTLVGGEEKTSSVTRGGYLEELQSRARALGIEERVKFAGPRPPEALSDCYRAADLFIYPSRYENFGQPLLEAAAHGLPLVATAVGVTESLLVDEATGLPLGDDRPETLAEAVRQWEPPEKRRRAGAALRRRVDRFFSWEAVLKAYLDLYRSFGVEAPPAL